MGKRGKKVSNETKLKVLRYVNKDKYSIPYTAEHFNISESEVRKIVRDDKRRRLEEEQKQHVTSLLIEDVTNHWKELRTLVKRMRDELSLPSSWDSFVEDFGGSGMHSQYSHDKLRIVFIWEVKEDDRVRVRLLCPVESDDRVEHLFKGLQDHLANSESSGILQTLEDRRTKGGEYLTLCHNLFLEVKNDIKEKRGVEIALSTDEEGFGITQQFVLTICVDAVNRASGFPLVSDFKYKHEPLPNGTYVLRFGANAIAVASSEIQLSSYEVMHKELRTKYSQSESSRSIAELCKEITELDMGISSELQKFSLTVPLPGYCELCKKALGLE